MIGVDGNSDYRRRVFGVRVPHPHGANRVDRAVAGDLLLFGFGAHRVIRGAVATEYTFDIVLVAALARWASLWSAPVAGPCTDKGKR